MYLKNKVVFIIVI